MKVDLTGQRFGRLRIIERAAPSNRPRWKCVCDCGNTCAVATKELRNGDTQSCGCLHRERTSQSNKRHGDTYSPEWNCWSGMLERCRYKGSRIYKYYGGRGIAVCERWKVFANFLSDMGRKPTSEHSIERIDNDGNYEPLNCRWATKKEQANNCRRCRFVSFRGENLSVSQWSDKTGIPAPTILARLTRLEWPVDRALTQKVA